MQNCEAYCLLWSESDLEPCPGSALFWLLCDFLLHKLHHPLLHIYKEKTRAYPGLGRGQRILDYAYLKEKREREEREEEEEEKEETAKTEMTPQK